MTDAVSKALAYFDERGAQRQPAATEEMIASAEERLGAAFPPSLREFLKLHNGLRLPQDEVVLGVPPVGEVTQLDIVESTLLLRKYGGPANLLVLTTDGTGDHGVLVLDQQGADGECPVGDMDHETREILYGASSYEQFLWFHLDRLQRFFEPDGTPKRAYYQWVGEVPEDEEDDDPEWMNEEPYLPWPHSDLAWILERDPALARLRPADGAEEE